MHAKTLLARDDSVARDHVPTKPRHVLPSAASSSVFKPNANSSDLRSTLATKKPPQRKASRESARNIEQQAAINQRKPRRTRNDRNPISPRERIPPGPPRPRSRCSRVGRSPNCETWFVHAIAITWPELPQPRRQPAWHSGTSRCSRENDLPRRRNHAWKLLIDSEPSCSTNSVAKTSSGGSCRANEAFEQRATTVTGRGRRG